MTKECREKIFRLNIFDFDEFRGPLKGSYGALKGPLRAKSSSFGDRNIILSNYLLKIMFLSVTKSNRRDCYF